MSAPDPAEVFVSYRPRRRGLILAGVVVLALLLVVGLAVVRATLSSPEATVEAYFAALADRNADAALERLAPEVTSDVEGELRSDGYTPPARVEVVGVSEDGRDAVAEVSYAVDGRERAAELRMRRDDGIRDRLIHRWLLIDGLGSIRIGEAPEEVTLNGERLPAYDAQGQPRLIPVLPGAYQVGVAEGDPLWDVRETTAVVDPADATEVDVPMAARPEVRPEVERQLTELLDRCAASTELVPPGCPFANTRVAEAEDVQWRITTYPTVGIGPGSNQGGRVAMLVTTTAEGEAVVTGTQLAFGTERPFEIKVPFPVSGVVSAREGTIAFEPGW